MRRIYESQALDRSDEDPHRPNERDATTKPQAARTLPSSTLSKALVPHWLRYRAISVSISTPQSVYDAQTPVPMAIEMHNRLPIPLTLSTTRTPWTWSVDGVVEASYSPDYANEGSSEFQFDRGERKQFRRHWNQLFKVTDSEWEECDPGEYTLSVAIGVDEPERHGLYDETTITIE